MFHLRVIFTPQNTHLNLNRSTLAAISSREAGAGLAISFHSVSHKTVIGWWGSEHYYMPSPCFRSSEQQWVPRTAYHWIHGHHCYSDHTIAIFPLSQFTILKTYSRARKLFLQSIHIKIIDIWNAIITQIIIITQTRIQSETVAILSATNVVGSEVTTVRRGHWLCQKTLCWGSV